MKLSDLKRGERARIKAINLDKDLKAQLIALGFAYGNEIAFERTAPLGDPQQYLVAGNYIAIRKEDAQRIEVEVE